MLKDKMNGLLKNKWFRLMAPVLVVWLFLGVLYLVRDGQTDSIFVQILFELGFLALPLLLNLVWLHQPIGLRLGVHGKRLWWDNWYGIYILILTVSKIIIKVFFRGHTDNVLGLFVLALSVGLAEEYIFRGMVLPLAIKAFAGKHQLFWGVTVSSLLFGLSHLANLSQQSAFVTLEQVLSTFAFGALMAAVYLKTGSIIFVMATHALQDFQIFLSNVYVQQAMPLAGSIISASILLGIVWLMLRPTKKRVVSLDLFGITKAS